MAENRRGTEHWRHRKGSVYPFRNPDALGRDGEDMTFRPQGPTAYKGYELAYYRHRTFAAHER
jgi:hypothetical protein